MHPGCGSTCSQVVSTAMRINRQRLTKRRTTPPCDSTCTDINAFEPSHYENSKVQMSLRLQHSCNPRHTLSLLGGPRFVRATRCTPHVAQSARMCGCPSHHAWTWVTSGTPPTTGVEPYTVLDVPSRRTPPRGSTRAPAYGGGSLRVADPTYDPLFDLPISQPSGTMPRDTRPSNAGIVKPGAWACSGRAAAPHLSFPRTSISPVLGV